MFRSLRTGEVIDECWLRFSYPTFWHYAVLRGLDYLRNAEVKPDSRVREAIEIVTKRRHQNGRWPLNLLHREPIPLEMETAVGSASRGIHCVLSESCVGTTTRHRSRNLGLCSGSKARLPWSASLVRAAQKLRLNPRGLSRAFRVRPPRLLHTAFRSPGTSWVLPDHLLVAAPSIGLAQSPHRMPGKNRP